MFSLFAKKSKKFVKAWEEKKTDGLSKKEKSLYALAKKIQESRIAEPGSVSISEEMRRRIKENFYHKYFNIIGSRQPAQKVFEQEKAKEPRKKFMPLQFKFNKMSLAFATAVVIFLALVVGYYFTRPGAGPGERPSLALAAHLAVSDGQVEIWNGSEWTPVAVGETVGAQSQLRTGESSKAVLEFDEGSALRLDENTHVILEELSNQKISVLQIVGETYSRVNKTSGLTYQVKTNETETTALGTAFGIACENSNYVKKDEKKVIVKVVESKVKVKIIKGEETLEKEVSEGEELVVDMTKPIENTAKKLPLSKEKTIKDNFYLWNREEDAKKSYPLGILDDVTPPEIKIIEPLDGIETTLSKVAVKGETEPEAKVWINGTEVENKEGVFLKTLDFKIGKNIIEVKAKDQSGNLAVKKITVTRKSETPAVGLYLKGYADADGIHLSWSVAGLEVTKGFKLVKSLEAYPTYPGDSAVWLDSGTRSYVWKIIDGKTYHFRICTYKDGSCGAYSNDVKITAKSETASKEIYGTLSLTGSIKTGRKVYLSWTLSGSAPYGFKLVKSLESNPTYPGSDYVYLSSPDVRSYIWDLAYPGTYHFRVCVYNGSGGCVFYSNDISITVE